MFAVGSTDVGFDGDASMLGEVVGFLEGLPEGSDVEGTAVSVRSAAEVGSVVVGDADGDASMLGEVVGFLDGLLDGSDVEGATVSVGVGSAAEVGIVVVEDADGDVSVLGLGEVVGFVDGFFDGSVIAVDSAPEVVCVFCEKRFPPASS